MALQGNIRDFGLADILQLIGLQKKTGLLEIQRGSDKAMVFFEEGQIVYANSSKKGDTEKIGRILVQARKITPGQLQEALNRQSDSDGLRVGQILESSGHVNREEVREAIQFQVKEILFHLFRWKDGTYRFEAQTLTYDKEYHIPLPTEFLLMEAIRMVDEWPYIQKKIPSFQIIFQRVLTQEDQAHPYLTEDEERVYLALDGKKDTEQVIEEVQIGEFEASKILANLLMSGLIRELGVSRKEVPEKSLQATQRTGSVLLFFQWPLVALGMFLLLWSGFPTSMVGWHELQPIFLKLKESITVYRMGKLDRSVHQFQLETGSYPNNIHSLLQYGFVKRRELRDGFGREFQYVATGDKGYRIETQR
jgi:predicted transcriptional regulator